VALQEAIFEADEERGYKVRQRRWLLFSFLSCLEIWLFGDEAKAQMGGGDASIFVVVPLPHESFRHSKRWSL
jgi:hypothetical protein